MRLVNLNIQKIKAVCVNIQQVHGNSKQKYLSNFIFQISLTASTIFQGVIMTNPSEYVCFTLKNLIIMYNYVLAMFHPIQAAILPIHILVWFVS